MHHAVKLIVIGVASACLHRRMQSRRQRSRHCIGSHDHGLASSPAQQTVLTPSAPGLLEAACASSPPATCGAASQHLLEAETLPEHQPDGSTTPAFTVTGPATGGPLMLQSSHEHTGCSSSSSLSSTAAMGSSSATESPAHPPRSPLACPSSQQRQLLPTPPPAGAAGLRALRRCISAPADRTTDAVADGGDAAALPSPQLSVRARAAMIEGRCGSCDSSPWSSPPASRASSSRCLFPASTRDSWSSDDSSVSGDDTERSEDGSMHSSPGSSCNGGSLLRASWGRSRSCRSSIGGDGASLLPFARASQHGAYGSPCKPNMPRIQGL